MKKYFALILMVFGSFGTFAEDKLEITQASYPILVTMAANDADEHLGPQTLQLFALTYFVGVFGFPLVAGWFIVEVGTTPLLVLVAMLAATEATLALRRGLKVSRAD